MSQPFVPGVNEGLPPGSLKGLQLVVSDIYAARAWLAERGVTVSEVQALGPEGRRPARDGEDLNNVGFIFLAIRTAMAGRCSR
jgi:hypothetical protein